MTRNNALALKTKVEKDFQKENLTKVRVQLENHNGEDNSFYLSVTRKVFGVTQSKIIDSAETYSKNSKLAFYKGSKNPLFTVI